jgi:outer membrane lipoprotein SlyB
MSGGRVSAEAKAILAILAIIFFVAFIAVRAVWGAETSTRSTGQNTVRIESEGANGSEVSVFAVMLGGDPHCGSIFRREGGEQLETKICNSGSGEPEAIQPEDDWQDDFATFGGAGGLPGLLGRAAAMIGGVNGRSVATVEAEVSDKIEGSPITNSRVRSPRSDATAIGDHGVTEIHPTTVHGVGGESQRHLARTKSPAADPVFVPLRGAVPSSRSDSALRGRPAFFDDDKPGNGNGNGNPPGSGAFCHLKATGDGGTLTAMRSGALVRLTATFPSSFPGVVSMHTIALNGAPIHPSVMWERLDLEGTPQARTVTLWCPPRCCATVAWMRPGSRAVHLQREVP